MTGTAVLTSSEVLPTSEAKWVTLKKLHWKDEDGKDRIWECAERKRRGVFGIDAVAVLAILRSESNAFPISTVVVEQFRPPVEQYVVELPAGLIDKNESPEDAAIRELEEETGFQADKVLDSSAVIVSDPGMTNANMKLVVLGVTFPNELKVNEAKLDDGEHIVKRIVPLEGLEQELKAYDRKGFAIDARLSHLASGWTLAAKLKDGSLF